MMTLNHTGSIGSKIDLKIKLLEISHRIGMDFDTLLAKFREEYEALPLSVEAESNRVFESLIPQIGELFSTLKENPTCEGCQGCASHVEDPSEAPEVAEETGNTSTAVE